MFKVFVNKRNNNELKRFIIPENSGYNRSSWIFITINGNKNFLMERFFEPFKIDESEWELKTNYAFPSALMTEFLRLDFDGDEITTTYF